MSFARVLKNLPGISQWQFIQKDKAAYVLKINRIKDSFDENETIKQMLLIIGNDADFSIEYVEEIPVLNSGKRKSVICEWKH